MIWLFFIIDKLYSAGSDLKPLKPPNQKQIIDLKEIIFYFNFAKSFLYLFTAVLTILERRKLNIEINQSPLLDVDDTLTEDIYRNIIEQSKNPGDPELLDEYKKICEKRRMSLNRASLDISHFGRDTFESINHKDSADAMASKGKCLCNI
jgi:hypothetical protein